MPDDAASTATPRGAAEVAPALPSPPTWRRWLGPVVRVLGTLALMALALRGVEWGRLWEVLRGADWRWWIAGLALMLAVQWIAAIRWAILARPVGFDFPLAVFVRRFFEGLFFNMFLPSSIGGDVVKAYRLADTNAGRVLAACTVLADRLAGLTALGLIATTALISHRHSLSALEAMAVAAALCGATMLAARLAVGNLERLGALLPAHPAAEAIVARLLPYQRRPTLVTSAIGWGLLVQVGGVLATSCVGRALGVQIPLLTWFMVVPLVSLATVLPISIGGVGVREGMMSVLLAPHGVRAETAVAIGLLSLLINLVCGLVGGIVFLGGARTTAPPPAGN